MTMTFPFLYCLALKDPMNPCNPMIKNPLKHLVITQKSCNFAADFDGWGSSHPHYYDNSSAW